MYRRPCIRFYLALSSLVWLHAVLPSWAADDETKEITKLVQDSQRRPRTWRLCGIHGHLGPRREVDRRAVGDT